MGVEFLISQGHPPSSVFGYSIRQFRSFLALAWGRTINNHLSVVTGTRIAYHADENKFTEFADSFSEE